MDLIEMQQWAYISDVPDDLGPIRDLLRTYSNIANEGIDDHLLRVVSCCCDLSDVCFHPLMTGPPAAARSMDHFPVPVRWAMEVSPTG